MPVALLTSLALVWPGCTRITSTGGDPPGDPTTPGPGPTGSDTGPAGPTGDPDTARPTGDTGTTTTVDVDCSVLPPLPVDFDVLQGFTRGEDFDFNAAGQHVSVRGNDLVGIDASGAIAVLSPNVGLLTAGTRALITGDYVIADSGVGGLVRIDGVTGGQTVVNSNMAYPNGVEVDALNRAYVADNTRNEVRMIDVYTGANGIIAEGLAFPNGVVLSPDEQTLYVGSFGRGRVYAIDRISDMEWDEPRILFQGDPNGQLDGINVDHCGNVYVTEYVTGRIYRITPDGSRADLVVDLPSGWIPNIRWGNEIGGWRRDRLYVADRDQARLFVLDVGVPGKKHLLMP